MYILQLPCCVFHASKLLFLLVFCSLKLDDSNNDDSTDDKEDEDGDNAKKVGD